MEDNQSSTLTRDMYKFWEEGWNTEREYPKEKLPGYNDGVKEGKQQLIQHLKDRINAIPESVNGDHYLATIMDILKDSDGGTD